VNKLLFLLPYLLSVAITTSVFFYTWRHRQVRSAQAYAWYVAGQILWGLGYIFELVSPELSGKIFWDQFQYVAGLIILISFPVFTIQYTETTISRPKLLLGLSFIVPISFIVFLLTDSQHHLLYPSAFLDNTYIFPELRYDFTWLVYAYAGYSYLVSFIGLILLIRRFIYPHRLYRSQILTIAFGFSLPLVFTFLTTVGVDFMPFRDVSPFTFAAGNIVVSWGLFRYKLFDIVPIARDIVVENINDLVFVFDNQDRLVDINRIALEAITKEEKQVIGLPGTTVLEKWPEIPEIFSNPENSISEITVNDSEGTFHYEVNSTLIYNKLGRYIGRAFVSRDVTERVALESNLKKLNEELEERVEKRTEELRESEGRYRRLAENAPDIIFRYTLSPIQILEYINPAVERILGYSPEECYADPLLMLNMTHPDDADLMIELMQSLEPPDKPIIMRWIGKDNVVHWMESRIVPIYDEENQIIAVEGLTRDITVRRQAEESLRESEERLRAIVDEAPFGAHLYELESDGRLVFVSANRSADQILRFDHQQFIGKTIEEAFPPLAETEIPAAYRQVAASGERIHLDRLTMTLAGFSGVYEIHVFKTDEQRIAVFFRDITERERAEKALRESEKKHRLVFEGANDAIFIMKGDVFVDCNAKATEMYGYTREELIGKKPQDFSPDIQPSGQPSEENAREKLGATLRTGESQYFEWRHIHKDGTGFDVEVSLNLLELDNEKFVQAIVRDITERKLAEKRLAEAYDTTLEGWAKALEMRDKETKDHSQRVVELTVTLAKAFGIEGDELVHLRRGAILHDIGKMGIPDEILRKGGKLTISERKIVEQHPDYSYELLSQIPFLEKALDIPYCHHERWDGSGYPRGLKGEEIPLAARIFSVVDVWDAVRSDRPF